VKLAIALATILALNQASLGEECWIGQESPLTAVDWSAETNAEGWTKVSIKIRNGFDKYVQGSLARAVFSSKKGPLDLSSGPQIFPQHIEAGQVRMVEFATSAPEYRKLLGSQGSRFKLQICLQTVTFDDGTGQRFLSPLSNQ
jgi:hypothetical protein